MKILRAEHLGMCFGVRDAIDLALEKSEQERLTILGELVHNETVLEELRHRGIRIESQVENVDTRMAMITAHGASEAAISRARQRGLKIVEATCPLVRFAHRSLADLVQAGFHPVVIGKRDHVEVRGLTEDLTVCDVVLSEADVALLREHSRFGVVAQTTQPIEKVRYLVGLIRTRFPKAEVRFTDTVCQPTKLRQNAAVELAKACEIVIVVGGSKSNNTRELASTCRRHGARVFQVQTAADLQAEWFRQVRTVGITAGTSTPDAVIGAVESKLREIAMMVEGGIGMGEREAQPSLAAI